MNNNKFYNWNPFVKGFISDEDRKKHLRWYSGKYEFYSNTIDLYDGLEIKFLKDEDNEVPSLPEYTSALSDFMTTWERDIRSHLNGFSGLDTIKFKFFGFGYIKLA